MLVNLKLTDVLTPGIDGRLFWPTTFKACIVRGMIGPHVVGKSKFRGFLRALETFYQSKQDQL